MRRVLVGLAVLAGWLAWAGTANAKRKAGDAIPGHYIVVLKQGSKSPKSVANARGITTQRVYGKALNGFAAKLSDAQVQRMRKLSNVKLVEQDRVYTADATQNMDANGDPWGLDRIDQAALPLSGTYTYGNSGAGVTAYVIDTGINASHSDFGGRAQNV